MSALRRLRPWPRSLAGRTAFVLLLALAVVQAAGLTIHAYDRFGLQRIAQARDLGFRIMSLYRSVVATPPEERATLLRDIGTTASFSFSLDPTPSADAVELPPPPMERELRVNMAFVAMPPMLRPRETIIHFDRRKAKLIASLRLPNGPWLNIRADMPPPNPWHSPTFLAAFALMTATAAVLILWAVRRLTEPVRTLAAAAERLGRDVDAPPLSETGPSEVATAAIAFNTMAARIRRFVQDRTFLLTAIGHDLRTPITRLKLRCEFIDDDEQRRKMLADLDELEAMVSATLAFGRDASASEPVSALDLPVLLRTVLDELGDARPEAASSLSLAGPDRLAVRARPISLKRAIANLVGNALAYGGSARVTLEPPAGGTVVIRIDDDGPGVPPAEIERIFEPFHRVESSRNRETGGTGLGLPIARNILRAHGGDVTVVNRPAGGARATVTLPA